MAPETLLGQEYDEKVDVWALGVIFYYLVTGLFVLNANSMQNLVDKQQRGEWSWPKDVKFTLQGLEFLNQTF